MKRNIFNAYVTEVCARFAVSEEMLFTKTKKRDIVDARQLLYYLCSLRPMSITYIQKYMGDRGYVINHSSIIHGIRIVKEKMVNDKDYIEAVGEILNEE